MTPEDLGDQRPTEELQPEDERTVRRLLAAAAADPASTPDDVVGRLDSVLAELQAERDPASDQDAAEAPVENLSVWRARRWPKVLVAAAAVAVVGVGLAEIASNDSQTSGSSTSAGAAAESAPDNALVAPSEADGKSTTDSQGSRGDGLAGSPVGAYTRTSALPQVRPGSVKVDAQRIYDMSLGASALATRPHDSARAVRCDLPAVTRGDRLVAVRLDGERASLLFHSPAAGPDASPDGAPDGAKREAEIYSCDDSGSPVLVTTVNAR